jgi:hypothetical protein
MAAATASRGLIWVGAAWVLGNLVSGLVALVYIPWRSEDRAPRPADSGPAFAAEPSGLFDDTVPMRFPWVTPDPRRARFGGDMAVRERDPAGPREKSKGLNW